MPQTITVASPLVLNNQAGPVTITGPGANLLTISGGNTNPTMPAGTQVFNITNQSSANDVISALTIANGYNSNNAQVSDGAGISVTGQLTIDHAVITNNLAHNYGAGIYAVYNFNNSSSLTITNSTISNNSTGDTVNGFYAAGGGIYDDGVPLTITNDIFSGNAATVGGGINITTPLTTITNSTFDGNYAYGAGGAIDAGGGTSGDKVIIVGSTISNNTAGGSGGIYDDALMTIVNSTIAKNSASGYGGGISFSGYLTVCSIIRIRT